MARWHPMEGQLLRQPQSPPHRVIYRKHLPPIQRQGMLRALRIPVRRARYSEYFARKGALPKPIPHTRIQAASSSRFRSRTAGGGLRPFICGENGVAASPALQPTLSGVPFIKFYFHEDFLQNAGLAMFPPTVPRFSPLDMPNFSPLYMPYSILTPMPLT